MDRSEGRRQEIETSPVDDFTAHLVARVRDNSQNRAQLTRMDALVAMLVELQTPAAQPDVENDGEPEPTESDIGPVEEEVVVPDDRDAPIADATEAPSEVDGLDEEGGPVETPSDANEASISDETEPVEGEAQLEGARQAAMARVAVSLAEISAVEEYKDITLVYDAEGALYLYSQDHMTARYARILLQVETNDASTLIAETVREESKIYPRPTPVELLTESPYNIDAAEIEALVDRTTESEEFKDIKRIAASTGAVYLYSDLHMSEAWARSLIESAETDYDENP